MRLGFHLSIAGKVTNAVREAARLGIECLQVFAGNPRGWKQRPLDPKEAAAFAQAAAVEGLDPVVVHAPYLVNLASPDENLWNKSVAMMADQLTRAHHLGAAAVVVHPGSRGNKSLEWGLDRVAVGVRRALGRAQGEAACWLESTPGGGGHMGGTLSQLRFFLDRLEGLSVGLCLDTAHLWAAGYRLDTVTAVSRFLDRAQALVGLDNIKLWHFNDIIHRRGSHRDQHTHIGQGKIGAAGFAVFMNEPRLREMAAIIETPKDKPGADAKNLRVLRSLEKSTDTGAGKS